MEGEGEGGGEGEREGMTKRGKRRKRSERSCFAYLSKTNSLGLWCRRISIGPQKICVQSCCRKPSGPPDRIKIPRFPTDALSLFSSAAKFFTGYQGQLHIYLLLKPKA